MIQLVEMRSTFPVSLHDGATSTTTEVWNTLVASPDGDLDRVKALAARCPPLLTCQYNYTPPLHFAVREGHLDLVRYLVSQGAIDPTYVTYPFKDSLVTMANDRGHLEIARSLSESLKDPQLIHAKGDTGGIEYGKNEIQRRFQKAVNHNEAAEAERLLEAQPELALDETASWGEGILMMPSNRKNRSLIELLMRYGARVPDLSKWGRAYYFKHDEIASFLLETGMNPNHMSWHHVTLLHDMAQEGDVEKAEMLLDYGADINPIEEEYCSTPLGLAARWGHRAMVAFLLDRGADSSLGGAEWATPLAWAKARGHADIEADLRRHSAK